MVGKKLKESKIILLGNFTTFDFNLIKKIKFTSVNEIRILVNMGKWYLVFLNSNNVHKM